jgi:hypothetical protein
MKKFFNSIFSTLREILSDEKNRLSSKRIVGIICAIFLCVTLYENSFSEEHIAPSVPLVQVVGALAFGCLGLSSIDKYTLRNSKKEKNESEQQPENEI